MASELVVAELLDFSPPRLEGLDALRRLLGEQGLRDLLRLFLDEGSRRLAALHEGFERQDHTAIAREAHAFKGCGASIGAQALARLCARLETEARRSCLDVATLDRLADEFGGLGALLAVEPLAPAPGAREPGPAAR
jgi:HPt (histidine-containing phosphotransfer) domain-containing protein